MNLDFSDEQKAAREQLRKLLAAHPGLASARCALDGRAAFDRALWLELGTGGWLGTTIPAAHGGQELGYEMLCGLAEEVGRSMAAIPFCSSAVLVTDALVRYGSNGQKARYLPPLACGERIGTVAWTTGAGPLLAQSGAKLLQGRLTGELTGVGDGLSADLFLVRATGEGRTGLYLVEAHAQGLQREPQTGLDPAHAPVRLRLAQVAAEPLPGCQDQRDMAALLDRAAIVMAFEQVGSATAALELAVSYAKERRAFGRAIGSFQAIKHKLADVYTANELARANAYYAAWALEAQAPPMPLAAAAARVAATEALERAARELIQTCGGVAVTWEHDAHLFYRRAQHLAVALGGLREWQHRLVGRLAEAV